LLLSPTAQTWHARRWIWLRGCCKGQYTFAADRHSAILAQLTDPWQPALLRTIDMIAKAAAATGKPVGICGEAAAHPLLALLLAGLGLSSLSMAPGALAEVGRSIGDSEHGGVPAGGAGSLSSPLPRFRPRGGLRDSRLLSVAN
jgi:phosphoenolpyruvate-protein phosphotransferase (PTS system enzyme I)